MTTFTITTKGRTPYYHQSRIDPGIFLVTYHPICGSMGEGHHRRYADHKDDTTDLAELNRKWENTVHPDLRCPRCTEEARRLQNLDGRTGLDEGEGQDAGPGPEDRQGAQ